MLQTDSAAAILPGPAMDKVSGKGTKQADDSGTFSQEFEKQVKKSTDPTSDSARSGAAAEQDKASDKAEKQEATVENSASTVAEKTDAGQEKPSVAKDVDAQSGKKLPPELAVADETANDTKMDSVKAESLPSAQQDSTDDAKSVSAEPAAAQLGALVEKKDKAMADLDKGQKVKQKDEDKSPVALPLFAAQNLTPDSAGTEEAEVSLVNDVRVRDVLAQRMMGGGSQDKGTFAGKSKADIATLAALQAGQGRTSQGGFDEVLKMSATAPVNNALQGAASPSALQPAAASVPVTMTLAMPVQQQGWDKAMAERVVWMARGNIQQAQIQLNPRDLGPIDIKITMQHDQAHVNFVAHHVATRDAIEAAIPRLRDMMNEQGLNLGQADVSHHSFGDSSRQAAAANGGLANGTAGQGGMEDELIEETPVTHHIGHVSASGVDYFA